MRWWLGLLAALMTAAGAQTQAEYTTDLQQRLTALEAGPQRYNGPLRCDIRLTATCVNKTANGTTDQRWQADCSGRLYWTIVAGMFRQYALVPDPKGGASGRYTGKIDDEDGTTTESLTLASWCNAVTADLLTLRGRPEAVPQNASLAMLGRGQRSYRNKHGGPRGDSEFDSTSPPFLLPSQQPGQPLEAGTTFTYQGTPLDQAVQATKPWAFTLRATRVQGSERCETVMNVRLFDPNAPTLLVEPANYATWLPEGGLTDGEVGKPLKIKVRLAPRKAGANTVKGYRCKSVTLQLTDVSREPGNCLNVPADKPGRTDPDLRWRSGDNPQAAVEDDGQRLVFRAKTAPGHAEVLTETLTEVNATLAVCDFGAWGTLRVVAELEDDRRLEGHLPGQAEGEPVLLPRRAEERFHIGQAWLEKIRWALGPEDWDDHVDVVEGKLIGNDHPGDGISVYEKYRGFRTRQGHQRLDPHHRALVVENHLGDAALPGFRVFTAATGAVIVDVPPKGLGEERIATINGHWARVRRQHGLRLMADTSLSELILGEAQPPPVKEQLTVATCDRVAVNASFTDKAKGQYKAKPDDKITPAQAARDKTEAKFTIAHELAHACGLLHHGKRRYAATRALDEDTQMILRFAKQPGSVVEFYDVEGKPLRSETLDKIQGFIGVRGNESSGDHACLMCYYDSCQYALQVEGGKLFRLFAVPQNPPTTWHLCTESTGTFYNRPDWTPVSLFGPANYMLEGYKNCAAEFRIKD